MDTDPLHGILDRLDAVRASGSGYSARCPAHADRISSLSVSVGETAGVVLHCHAGCSVQDVLTAMGASMADLAGQPRVVASYPYHDADGQVLYTVERWSPKTFRVRPGLPDLAHRVVFGLQWVSYARDCDRMLYVVEGEKDALTLINAGIPATTNVGGAGVGKWLPHYSDQLAGCTVTVIADNDEPGKAHARAIVASLTGAAKSVVAGVPAYGNDVTEMLAAGYPLDHLVPLEELQPLPVVTSSGVSPRKVTWVWPGYFPAGKLSTVEGDPGGGKSTLTIDLVARWSTGAAMPDGVAHPGPYGCLMISAEDDPEDTVVPRLVAAGADLRRVHLLSSGAVPELPFNLGTDMDALDKTIENLGIGIVVLDPLSSFLPDDADSHSDHKIRRALYPLHLLARRRNVAVLAVRHLSKSATKAIHAGNGSIGIIAAARAAFMVGISPDDPGLRILAPVKCNLSPPPAALRYRIQIDPLHDVGRVVWDGPVETSAQDVLDGEKGQDERLVRDDAREFLTELCAQTPLTWRDIAAQGKQDGYAEITLRRVRNSVLTKCPYPMAPDGTIIPGTFWVRSDRAVTAGSQLAHLIASTPHEQESKRATAATASDNPPAPGPDPEAEMYLRPKVCDVCGSAEAIYFGMPHFVARCRPHDPRSWSNPTPAGGDHA